ncbi:Aldehyde/histidinol dehydrogenase [Pelagophyceae sp. CCMP2097]|nr:Aldehyde/histidinol dehydrogenase [Pelagophyceae sp. CCMP2097]
MAEEAPYTCQRHAPLAAGGRAKPFVDGALTFIDGVVAPWAGRIDAVSSPVYDDATGERAVIGKLSSLDGEASLSAVKAAAKAWDEGQGEWPQMALSGRVAAVEAYLVALAESREAIIEALMWEIAKTAKDAAAEFDRTMEFARAVLAHVKTSDAGPLGSWTTVDGIRARVRRGPVGVTLMLAPFNYPLNEMYAMMIPALVMGNCIVLKLPAIGALAHVLSIDALKRTLPPGVVNFVSGSGRATLPPVMESGLVDCLGFIGGSKGADALIKQHPHPHRLRVFSQLEGKNLGVVLSDADLDVSAREIVAGALAYNGQRCTAIKLVAAHRSVADALVAKIAALVDALPRGLPWSPGTAITPLPETGKPAFLEALLSDAVGKGAKIVNAGGGDVAGALFTPAVVYPINQKMRLFHEEQFGPVVPVWAFDDVADVVAALKSSWNGQQAAIFTQSETESAVLVDALSTIVGRINLNLQCKRGPDEFPFSGRRSSAMGTMSTTEALRAFSVETLVATRPLDADLAAKLDAAATFLAPLE